MEPMQPSKLFIFITFAIVLLYSINSIADPYENCDVKKIVTYDGKELISAEVRFNCESRYKSDNNVVDKDLGNVVELPVIEELPQVVSLTEFYNNWMN